jgi:hypothetical protein
MAASARLIVASDLNDSRAMVSIEGHAVRVCLLW